MKPKLYSYFRSSAAYRVRAALNLKGMDYDIVPVHLVRDGGEQKQAAYLAKNPQGLVPALELTDGTVLTQSMAILEYLEETVPSPALLPPDPAARARVRAVADIVACDIHPLNNLRVLKYLKDPLGHDQESVNAWYRHWVRVGGLKAVEAQIEGSPFAFGDTPGLADAVIVPQLYNARRFEVALDDCPKLETLEAACAAHPAFIAAHPDNQPDAPQQNNET